MALKQVSTQIRNNTTEEKHIGSQSYTNNEGHITDNECNVEKEKK
jgi:hypothetical protein